MLNEKIDRDSIEFVNRIKKLFRYLQQEFTLFRDVDLQFTFGPKMKRTCCYYNCDEDKSVVYINFDEADLFIKSFGELAKKDIEEEEIKIKNVNQNFSWLEYALLHELGHTTQRMIETLEDSENIHVMNEAYMISAYRRYRTEPERLLLYRLMPEERDADINAMSLLKFITKHQEEFDAFDNYYHTKKAKTLQERLREEYGDYFDTY